MIIAIIVFAVAMIIGVPVAFALGLMGSVHVVSLGNPSYYLVIIQRLIDQVNMTSLTCLPFFILAGELMNGGGVTRRLLDFLRSLLGWLKGGLAYCTVVIAAILSAILGSPNGVASMLCGILVPEMRKDGYKEEFTGSLVAASSILGPIIPPSTSFIMYCMMTNCSIKALFMAGIVPGLALVAVFCALIAYYGKKMGFKRDDNGFRWGAVGRSFIKALPALIVPVVMMGGVVTGLFTATESGAVACLCALIAAAIYREMDWKKLPNMLLRAAVTGGGILLMISFGGVIAWSMTRAGIPNQVIALVTSITNSKFLLTLLMIIILMIGGMFLDTGTLTMVFLPVMFPLATAIGMDIVHFGLIFSVMTIIGYITPPVGVVLFVTSNASGIPFSKLCKTIWPFAIVSAIVTTLLAYLPDICLWIPRLTGYAG